MTDDIIGFGSCRGMCDRRADILDIEEDMEDC